MVIATQEAPLTKGNISKEDVLRMIARLRVNNGKPLFYRPHLDREYVLGTIGDRGGGKSGSDAVISIIDFMLAGKPVWSNMRISCDIKVEDQFAIEVGLNSGGIVHLESQLIEKDSLLKLDETYRDGCLVIEEINVQFSNVRRFMTNTNIDFNEVCQQLRKFKVSMIYNVIDEMFIDPQLRALTDIFIRTYDTAFDIDAMSRKKKPGIDFCWRIYPITGYIKGEQGRYAVTHKVEKAYFHFEPWHNVYDSMQHQEKGTYSLNKREREKALKEGIIAESSKDMKETINEWQWLIDKVIQLKDSGQTEIHASPLWAFLDIISHGKTPYEMGKVLPAYGIKHFKWDSKAKDHIYTIESYNIDNIFNKKRASEALARST